MYDVSKEFRKFYKNYVVLQSEKQQNLRDKKDLNIKCILQSPADSDAFQSGRCAKHNGRPETMYF